MADVLLCFWESLLFGTCRALEQAALMVTHGGVRGLEFILIPKPCDPNPLALVTQGGARGTICLHLGKCVDLVQCRAGWKRGS